MRLRSQKARLIQILVKRWQVDGQNMKEDAESVRERVVAGAVSGSHSGRLVDFPFRRVIFLRS